MKYLIAILLLIIAVHACKDDSDVLETCKKHHSDAICFHTLNY